MSNDADLGDVLENRYAKSHVGGAFDAKYIPKPRTVEKALTSATMGRKSDESLMIEGLSLDKYVKHDEIISEKKYQPSLNVRNVKVKTPDAKPSFRTNTVQPSIVTPGQPNVSNRNGKSQSPILKPTLRSGTFISNVIPGQPNNQNRYGKSLTPERMELPPRASVVNNTVIPGNSGVSNRNSKPKTPEANPVLRSIIINTVVPGQNVRPKGVKMPPQGTGVPGIPLQRPFIPTPAKPFGPIINPKTPIYWDTDPDIWDLNKLIGQIFWDY